MQRVRRWIASELIPPRRRRSDAGRVAVLLGAGIVSLTLGATVVVRPLRSRLQAVPAELGRASGLFGRLITTARRTSNDGSSQVLTGEDTDNGVQPKAPAARSTAGVDASTRVRA